MLLFLAHRDIVYSLARNLCQRL